MSNHLSVETVKSQAKTLRATLADAGHAISHSQSLELLAKQHGHRDWNTFVADIGNRPAVPWSVGDRVTGQYLGRDFSGELIGLREFGDARRFRVTIRFDTPVDVVAFESFSNLRRQISAIVDHAGRTAEKTSDGVPHLVLKR